MSTPPLKSKILINISMNARTIPKILTKLSFIEHLFHSQHESKIDNITKITKSSVLLKIADAKMNTPHNKNYDI